MKHLFALLTVFLMTVQIPAQAEIKADYIFAGSLVGNIAGAPDIEYLGSAPQYEPGQIQGLGVTALQIESGTGLKLDLSQWSICDQYTLVIHGYMDEVVGYKKLIDFRDLSGDPGIYNNNGVLEYVVGQTAISAEMVTDQYFQLVLTRDSNDLVNAYLDGELQLSYTDNSTSTSMCLTDNFYLFSDDLATNVENPQGAVARVTIYDHALTAGEVGELEILDIIYANDFAAIKLP